MQHLTEEACNTSRTASEIKISTKINARFSKKINHLPGLPDKHGKLNVCVINLISLCKSFLSDYEILNLAR